MVGYIDPFNTKLGRKEFKRYGCVLTCLSSRAVHVEAAESLETNAFLEAVFHFRDRRTRPANVYSDNATNFVGTERILQQGIRNINQGRIVTSLAQH